MKIIKKILILLFIIVVLPSIFIVSYIYIKDKDRPYYIVKQMLDSETNKIVELGFHPPALADLGLYGIFIFEKKIKSRKNPVFNLPIILIKQPDAEPTLVYENGCYILKSEKSRIVAYEKEWTNFWGTQQLCFRLVMDGKEVIQEY
ncbi:MAG: hypothetical protein AAF228_13575 [Pseudomonadota bacterium]